MPIPWTILVAAGRQARRWRETAALKSRQPKQTGGPADHDFAEPIAPAPSRSATPADPFEQALAEAAWNGCVSDGLITQGYQQLRAGAMRDRENEVACHSELSGRLTALEAELEAAVFERPARPMPKVLHLVRTPPFGTGGHVS